MLKDAGIARDECWVTNACKYELTPLAKGNKRKFTDRISDIGVDWNHCVDELRSELLQINPNVIVPLGASALWSITGKSKIHKLRGSIIQGFGKKVIGTYHPAHILYQRRRCKRILE